MKPRHAPKVTVQSKRRDAFVAIHNIELHKLSPDRIEMLAANVYSRVLQPALWARMVAELNATLEHRKAREAGQ